MSVALQHVERVMSSLDRLNTRLKYQGGNAEGRFINDKLNTLKKSLLYSYQAETAILADGREFRCLINPNKETTDYDNKIISIPYFDVCLNPSSNISKTSEGLEEIGLKCGDVFTWKETDTHWLVYLEYLEENAYFRAQIRRCDQEVQIGEDKYWTYIRGPMETSIPWNQKGGVEWNDINYSLVMYVTCDDNTINTLHRFSKIKIPEPHTGVEKTWQVVAVNPYHGDGIIEVALDEYFDNSIADAAAAEKEQNTVPQEPVIKGIVGPSEVPAYSSATYSLVGLTGGEWFVEQKNQVTSFGIEDEVTIDVNMKKGSFKIFYKIDGLIAAELVVSVVM